MQEDVSFRGLFLPFTTKKAIIFLCLIGFGLFFLSFFNGFVGDDNTQVVSNVSVHSLGNIPSFFFENRLSLGNTKLGGGYYKPLLDTSFALLYALFGLNPFGYHAVGTMLFIINSVLIFLFFKKYINASWAFVLALLFLVHPINSEVALSVSDIQDILFVTFGMLSLLLLQKTTSVNGLIIASGGLLLSLFSKETGILFAIIAIFYVFLYKKTAFWKFFLLVSCVIGGYGLFRIHAVGIMTHAAINAPIERLSVGSRLTNIPLMLFFYIKTLLSPLFLSSSWQWVVTQIDMRTFFIPFIIDGLIGMVVVGIGLYLVKKDKRPFYFFFAFWTGLGLLFHMQVLPLDQTVAERWFYFPFIGILGMIGIVLESTKVKMNARTIVAICLVITTFSVRTWMRGFDFVDDMTLASRDVKVSPDSYNLEYILSHEYYMQGKLPQAKVHAEKSVRLFPYITNYTNLGAIESSMGDYKHAKESYLKALTYGEDSLPYENLAALGYVYGDWRENTQFIQTVSLKKYPSDGALWLSLTIIAYRNGDIRTAQEALGKAKHYSNDPYLPLVAYAVEHNKPLQMEVGNGMVNFSTVQ